MTVVVYFQMQQSPVSANSATAKPSGSFESPVENDDDGGDDDDDDNKDDDDDDDDNDCDDDSDDGGDDDGITGDDNHQLQSHRAALNHLDCEFGVIKDIFCNIIAALKANSSDQKLAPRGS